MIGDAEARGLNAAIPFALSVGDPARAFPEIAHDVDRLRATDCLAISAMAEAGDSDDGQRAVIQVILNRVNHPAFAKTICGVVFEGSQRRTGCQFSFTCDGALARRYSAAAWTRARARAQAALAGRTYAPVGLATHYHTDWVHPYWSAALVKVAAVETHLFFRWSGFWGSAAAASVAYRGGEPAIPQLGYLSAHNDAAGTVAAHDDDENLHEPAVRDAIVRNEDGGAFVLLASASSPEAARDLGRSICGGRPSCKVLGWFDRTAIPLGYPVPASARARLGFSYSRGFSHDEAIMYDCTRFDAVAADACLPTAMSRLAARKARPASTAAAATVLPVEPGTNATFGPSHPDVAASVATKTVEIAAR